MTLALRVLLVEDSDTDAALLLDALRAGGFAPEARRVETAGALQDALRRPWDVVIADVVLPRFSGAEALAQVRARDPRLPVIAVSGRVGEEVAAEIMRAGARDFVLKDQLARLAPAVARELAAARERREAEDALRQAYAELERRVEERTEALRESEERFRQLAELAPVGIFYGNARVEVTYVNPRWSEITGRPPEDGLQRNWKQGVHPDDLPLVEREEAAAFRERREFSLEFRYLTPGGQIKWILVQTRLFFTPEGTITGFVGTVLDTTARTQAEEALRESEERFRQLAELAPVAVFYGNARGEITYFNPRWRELTGWPVEPSLGWGWLEHVYPEDSAWVQRTIEAAMRERPDIVLLEYRYLTPEGRIKWFIVHVRILTEDGAMTGLLGTGLDVTERKETEEALRASEELLKALVDTLPVGVMLVDAEGRFTLVNAEAHRLVGGAVTGSAYGPHGEYTLLRPDGTPMPVSELPLPQVLAFHETVTSVELLIRSQQGNETSVLASASPVFAADGRLIGAVAAIQDITEQKRAETALQEQRAFLRTVIDTVPNFIAVKNWEGRFLLANRALADFYGTTPEAIIGNTDADFNPTPEEVDHFRRDDQEVMRTCTPKTIAQERVTDRTGQLRWLSTIKVPLIRRDGTCDTVLLATHDITERMQAEEERERLLAEVQARVAELDAVFHASVTGLIVYDAQGAIRLINEEAQRIFHYTPEEQQLPVEERTALHRQEMPDGAPMPLEASPNLRALRGETVRGVVFHSLRNGGHWLSISGAPIRTPDGRILGAVINLTDITALHELQEQLRALLQTVSHDLRLPLTTIQGHAQFLQKECELRELDGRLTPSLAAILRAAQRMNGMIQDLVDAARMEGAHLRLERQPVQLPAYLRDLLRRNAAILEAERIRIEAPDDLPAVFADYDRLERIITNLLINALKYSPPGSPVLVRARALPDAVEVSVTDQGRGIPPEALPHLFERFYRVPGQEGAEGLGLGLYITKLLVDAHGGTIRVDSQVGQGSTFTITLPRAGEGGGGKR